MSAPALGSDFLSPRPGYRALAAYNAEPASVDLDLSDNTNQLGAPPAAVRALATYASQALTRAARYPSLYSRPLRTALAQYIGALPDEIIVGCGSDDILDCAMRAFGEPGEKMAYMEPTFMMARTFAATNSLVPVAVPLNGDWDVDADALLDTAARIIYLCAPNNPTGTTASRGAVERVLDHAPGIVIIDEAYGEFANDTYVGEAAARGRVLVTRTFSKAFGLAGLRVGYGVASRALIAEMEKARGPYKVTAAAEAAAEAALREDLPWMRAGVASVIESRDRFAAALRAIGLSPLPSNANFVLVPVLDARIIAAALEQGGIAVRAFSGLPHVGDAIRITIAPWPVMARVVDALPEALACA